MLHYYFTSQFCAAALEWRLQQQIKKPQQQMTKHNNKDKTMAADKKTLISN